MSSRKKQHKNFLMLKKIYFNQKFFFFYRFFRGQAKKKKLFQTITLILSMPASRVSPLAFSCTTRQMMRGAPFRTDRFEDITVVNTHLLSKSPELAVKSCSILLIKRLNILWIVIAKCKSAQRCHAWTACVPWKDLVVHFVPHFSCKMQLLQCFHWNVKVLTTVALTATAQKAFF